MSELFNLSIDAYNINELKDMLNLQDPYNEDIKIVKCFEGKTIYG